MIFRVGIENNNEGVRSIAWALEHPGCFAYGSDEKEAIANLPTAIQAYSVWIGRHESLWLDETNVELKVEESFTALYINEAFERVGHSDDEVNAWFQHDWKPLTARDVEQGLELLSWTRSDLLDTIAGLGDEKLDQNYPNERWSIHGILGHIGGAEWWYLNRLGVAFPRSEVPPEPMERLEKVRNHLIRLLPMLEGSKQVVGISGEFWSPRKMLRRAVWHEKDHILHIQKLL
jgi:hypothetical protein